MKAFIHAFQGKPWNEECQAAYNGFIKMGIECVLFTTNEELDKRKAEDIVVGGMLMMSHVFNEIGLITPVLDYPESLSQFRGRMIRKCRLSEIKSMVIPFFIKPVEEKAAKGVVVYSWDDINEYDHLDDNALVYCSEVVDFISEWRCFVRYGKIIGVQHYYGDRTAVCDMNIMEDAVRCYTDMPSACALDFGVTSGGRTLLVEVNDGYALGCYGLNDVMYAKLLSARWAELTGTEDECAFNVR